MKTILKSTIKVRVLNLSSTLILLYLLFTCNVSIAGNLVEIGSIKVSKSYPASFVLDLERNDIVTVKYTLNGGNADLSELSVIVYDLNQQEEVKINTFNRSGRDFLAPYDGKYRVDFIYNGKGSGIFKQRSLDLALSLDLEGYGGMKEGESKEVLHATNCVIEETESNGLKLKYFLTKGDKITISSQDSKAAFLKLKVLQLAKVYSVSGTVVINIPADGTYSFTFYLEEAEDGSLFNLKDLISKSDYLFNDLSIYIEKAIDFAALNKANSQNSNTNATPNANSDDLFNNSDNSDAGEAGNGLGFDLEKLLANGNKSSEESQKLMIEAINAMQESLNKKNVRIEITSIPGEISMKLEPEFNFSNNEHRKCELIKLQPTDFNIWFYWVGVGEGAEKAYEEHNSEITNIYKKSLADAAAEHIYGKFGNPSMGRKNPSFPDEQKYGQYLFEDAEYAVVDFNNRIKFLAGERYQKMNQPTKRTSYITSDNGISGRSESDIFFCACNNNKATPVKILFKFFSIQPDEFEY